MSLQNLIEERSQQFDEQFTEPNPGWRESGFTGETILRDNVYPEQLKKFHSQSINMIIEKIVEMMNVEKRIHKQLSHEWTGICLKKEKHTINPHAEKVEVLEKIISQLQTLKKHRLRCLYFIHSMFYIQKIEKESDVRAGDKVMLLVDGAGKHAGDKGTITEVVRGGLTIAWEGDYSWGRRPEFDVFTSDEFEFLALGTPEYPWPKRLIVRTRNKKMSEDLDKIVEEEITKEDEQRFYRNLRKDPEALDEERGIRRGGASGSGWQPMMGIDDLVKPCGCKGPCHL